MNHLIIRTHYGTNINVLKNYLLNNISNVDGWIFDYSTKSYVKIDIDNTDMSNVFFRFIEENNFDSFISQYNTDKDNNLISTEIPVEALDKNNWASTFSNIIEIIENSYTLNLKTEWFIYIVYTYPLTLKNKDKAKTIWLIRNPTMSWAYKKIANNPKKMFYDIKMISNEYTKESIKWLNESINILNIPKMLKPYLQSLDIESTINFIFLFALLCVRPSNFSQNTHTIENIKLKEILLIINNYFNIDIFKNILKTSKNIPSLNDFNYNGNIEKIFEDMEILNKMKDLSQIFNIIYNKIPEINKQTYIYLIQNVIYNIKKINKFWNIFDSNKFLQQNLFEKEFLINIDNESYNWFFNLLTKIDLDEMLKGDITTKLENPRENPLILEDLKNIRPSNSQTSEEFLSAYTLGYDLQINELQSKIEELGFNDGLNKSPQIKYELFANGFLTGFTDGFNDGINAKQQKLFWNSLISTYEDGYSYGYDKGYSGGVSLLNSMGEIAKQQINMYYDGLKNGIFDSIQDINQKIYDYNYNSGYYDKKLLKLNSNIENGLINSLKYYIHNLLKIPVKDKLINYEDLVQPKAVETFSSIMRFFYLYYFSDDTHLKDLTDDNIIDLIIPQNLALLDLNIFLGQQDIPSNVNFQRFNNWITYEELFNKNINKFNNYIYTWEDEMYLGNDYEGTNPNLNTFKLINQRENFDFNRWLYEGNRYPDQFDKNTK